VNTLLSILIIGIHIPKHSVIFIYQCVYSNINSTFHFDLSILQILHFHCTYLAQENVILTTMSTTASPTAPSSPHDDDVQIIDLSATDDGAIVVADNNEHDDAADNSVSAEPDDGVTDDVIGSNELTIVQVSPNSNAVRFACSVFYNARSQQSFAVRDFWLKQSFAVRDFLLKSRKANVRWLCVNLYFREANSYFLFVLFTIICCS